FRKEYKWKEALPVAMNILEATLQKMNVTINRKRMNSMDALQDLRSYYSATNKTLFINTSFSSAQEKFLIAREIGFHYLGITDRPYETIIQHSDSFDMVLNNFKASYFAVALLMPEENFTEDVKRIVMQPKWNDKAWLDLCTRYDVTPEMMMQRLT